ncbi:MAG: phosphate ABC transporter permease subunit PstC [Actinobacteria bacterium 13_1_40CM_2_66_13]|nr:MAG: phosphate ABC transporter permease subunit PstC [Actinobacteria bacterium 13_1_40CM_2_66_13]TMF85963.1 MAG: phosphate ABC transporter permease subunit PstC [Chloroflexota bacterium]
MAVRAEAKAGIVTSRPRDGFQWVVGIVASAVPALLLLIVLTLLQQAMPAIQHFGLAFVVNTDWNPVTENFGAAPAIFGTVFTAFLALALALPVGVAVAVVLAEPGHTTLRGFVGTGIELLAAIPSVVYGIWALYVLAPWSYEHIEVPISEHAGFIGWLGSPAVRGLFNASLVLAVMILPTLTAISRDVIKAVPRGLKENAVALGATWWETTWRVILPSARAGIFGATILALGRALGETIAVTMVIGNQYVIPHTIFQPAYTLASVIANEFTEATGTLYPAALIELGLVLILVTFVVNMLALLLVQSSTRDARRAV